MKNYKVVVNGTAYEVSVEEISAAEVKAAPVVTPAADPVVAPAAAPAPVAAPAGGEKVEAPMPGTILDVKVSNGQAVKKGDIVAILESMKMENELFAPCDGTVAGLAVSQGASVNAGDLICTIQ